MTSDFIFNEMNDHTCIGKQSHTATGTVLSKSPTLYCLKLQRYSKEQAQFLTISSLQAKPSWSCSNGPGDESCSQ